MTRLKPSASAEKTKAGKRQTGKGKITGYASQTEKNALPEVTRNIS